LLAIGILVAGASGFAPFDVFFSPGGSMRERFCMLALVLLFGGLPFPLAVVFIIVEDRGPRTEARTSDRITGAA